MVHGMLFLAVEGAVGWRTERRGSGSHQRHRLTPTFHTFRLTGALPEADTGGGGNQAIPPKGPKKQTVFRIYFF